MPKIIGIAGGSGSGKSTLALKLAEVLGKERSAFISADHYYFDFIAKGEDPQKVNYDHPESLEYDLLIKHLNELKKGKIIDLPVYEFSTHKRSVKTEALIPREYILVEGLHLFYLEKLNALLDLKIYIQTPAEVRLTRRIRRDVLERGRSLESILEQFEQQVMPMHRKYVEPCMTKADICIDGTYTLVKLISQITPKLP